LGTKGKYFALSWSIIGIPAAFGPFGCQKSGV
jgi:hypothetical protein